MARRPVVSRIYRERSKWFKFNQGAPSPKGRFIYMTKKQNKIHWLSWVGIIFMLLLSAGLSYLMVQRLNVDSETVAEESVDLNVKKNFWNFSQAEPEPEQVLQKEVEQIAKQALTNIAEKPSEPPAEPEPKTFRDKIKQNILPQYEDIVYKDLFSEYYFDFGPIVDCEEVLCPGYSYASALDPLSGQVRNYLSAGVGTNFLLNQLPDQNLNLVVVIDISFAMSESFEKLPANSPLADRSKLALLLDGLASRIELLKPQDRLSIVLVNEQVHLAMPFYKVRSIDLSELKKHLLNIRPQGSANMQAGLRTAIELIQNSGQGIINQSENRILAFSASDYAEEINLPRKIHLSFSHLGQYDNLRFISPIDSWFGSKYFVLTDPATLNDFFNAEFRRRLMPLAYNLRLSVDSQDMPILQVYDEKYQGEGIVYSDPTVFQDDDLIYGDIPMRFMQMTTATESREVVIRLSYDLPDGEAKEVKRKIIFDASPGTFVNSGLQKAVLVSLYADLMKSWLIDQRLYLFNRNDPDYVFVPLIGEDKGISPLAEDLSVPQDDFALSVHDYYKSMIVKFSEFFTEEREILKDSSLLKELEVLQKMIE